MCLHPFNIIYTYIKTINKTINEQKEGKTFLGKKTKTSNKKLVSEKKEGKISTKRKKVIDEIAASR